jgi:predicted RNA binding protein YcfA (HicA-like mRNA interferase family)
MEDNFNCKVEGLESDLAAMDKSHREAMKRQSDKFYQNLTQLKDWTESTIDDLENKVNDTFDKQQSQIDEQRESIKRLYQKDADENKQAQLMLKDLKILVAASGARTNHSKFAEDKWNQLKRRVENISKANVPAGSIIGEVMNLTNDIWDLEEDVLREQLKFEVIHNLVLNQATELLLTMSKNRNDVFFTDDEGKNKKDENGNEIKVELDYWTKGQYGEVEKQVIKLKEELEMKKNISDLTEERVNKIQEEIEKLKSAQSELIVLAVRRGLASQERRNISKDIVKALKQQGYDFKKMEKDTNAYHYLGSEERPSDFREGVFAVLKNGTGMEITVIVHPNEDLTKNHIVFQRNDNSPVTAAELRNSIDGVRKIIASKGYKMGSVAEPEGTGDVKQTELVDANALAKVGISNDLKTRLGFTTQRNRK